MKFNATKLLIGMSAAVLLVLAAAQPAAAQTPLASGTVRHTNDAAWGTWEAFETTSNAFGFFIRIQYNGNNVMTVVPFETLADGRVQFWWISYTLVGGTDPNRTEGWQWVETASGRLVLDPATVTAGSVDGALTTLATGTQNQPRVPVPNPQPVGVRFTLP